jgi:hypothetical protein
MESGTQMASDKIFTNFQAPLQTTTIYPYSGQPHIGDLVAALALAQADFSPLFKESENPFYKSKYADLAAVIKATLPALNKHGLSVIQLNSTDFINKAGVVTTILAHKSGQSLTSVVSIPTGQKFDAQSLGIAFTYGRRYAYQAIVGVAADVDDDANSISTGFSQELKIPKYEPKPGKKPFTGPSWKNPEPVKGTESGKFYMKNDKTQSWDEVNKEEFITGKSPESGQPSVPAAKIPGPVTVNTNANFKEDSEPTAEQKTEFKTKARNYVKVFLPEAGVENPADTLKAFVEKLTGQADTKKLTVNQWIATFEALDAAVAAGKLKQVVEG